MKKTRTRIGGNNVGMAIALAVAVFVSGSAVAAGAMSELGKSPSKTKKTIVTSKKKNAHQTNVENSFKTPDFAFPTTVAENAEAVLKRSANVSDDELIRAAIQLTIAKDRISNDNAVAMATMLDSLAAQRNAPYNSILYLLEGQLYKEMYGDDSWRYNQRNLPLDNFPANPKEWSKDLFALKILELSEKASADFESLQNIPISNIKSLLTLDGGKAPVAQSLPSVADFVAETVDFNLKSFVGQEIILPFGSLGGLGKRSISEQISQYLDALDSRCIAKHKADGQMQAATSAVLRYADRQPEYKREAILLENLAQVNGKPEALRYIAPISSLIDFDDENYVVADTLPMRQIVTSKRDFYNYSSSLLKQYPDTVGSGAVSDVLYSMSRKIVDFDTKAQWLSTDTITVDIKQSNISKAYVLLMRLPGMPNRWTQVNKLLSGASLVQAYPLETSDSIPFEKSRKVEINPLPYGCYAVIPSSSATVDGISKNVKNNTAVIFVVSDLGVVSSNDYRTAEGCRIYVVDGRNQKPIAGAEVAVRNNATKQTKTLRTNEDGYVTAENGSYSVGVKYGKDRIESSYYNHSYRNSDNEETVNVTFLTDLSVYKPGQKVQFALIADKSKNNKQRVFPAAPFTVTLRDANGNPVDSLKLTTDAMGRANGEFTLPENGLLGTWSLQTECDSNNEYGFFEVADYKAPSFTVEVESASTSAENADIFTIKGKALTYSGMPLAGAPVKFNIKYEAGFLWWRRSSVDASYAGDAITDANGDFTIELDTKGLKGTPYACGRYALTVDVTDANGETQQAPVKHFALGNAYKIEATANPVIEITSDSISIPVKVVDLVGADAQKSVRYSLYPIVNGKEQKTVCAADGECMPGILKISARNLKSGNYKLQMALADDDKVNEFLDFVVYRPSDKVPPVETPLWLPANSIVAEKNAKSVKVPVGTSYPYSYLLCTAFDTEKILWQKWVKNDGSIKNIEVETPSDNGRVWLNVVGMHNLKGNGKTVEIKPYESANKLEIVAETFRDKIVPGDKERWTFRFKPLQGGNPDIAAMAVMSNEALNKIAPFVWNKPQRWFNWSQAGGVNPWSVSNLSDSYLMESRDKYKNNISFPIPSIDTYNCTLYFTFGGYRIRGTRMYNATSVGSEDLMMCESVVAANEMKMSASVAAPKMRYAKEESAADTAAQTTGEDGGNGGAQSENLPLRGIEHPLAFFMPSLSASKDGIVEVSFEVPNFNTTWQLQMLGYTPEMMSALETYRTLSSKPVMVQTNVPRFLRTGDTTKLKATLYNNSDKKNNVGGRIEVFNPLTEEVIVSYDSPSASVDAMASRTIEVEFTVPSEVNYVGVRSYAFNDSHRDGEQALISILPSSAPVIESTPFYLDPKQEEMSVILPKMKKGSSATLQYCDNPAWVCLTALPEFSLESNASLLSKIKALYGSAVANGLVAKMPQAKDAIRTWLANPADSVLMSPLQKNEQLKVVALAETPWVNNASSETLRMLRLGHLLDTKGNDARISKLIDEIAALQCSDGGFAWCPGMESSEWITSRALLYLGMLRQLGYQPSSSKIDKMTQRAIAYSDKKLLKYVKECKDNYPLSTMLNYYYVRSMFDVITSYAIAKDREHCLSLIKKDWRTLGIYDAATAAILLNRTNNKAAASTILESLSQRASSAAGKGLWFDNLASGYGGFDKLITTTQALEAFAEIAPDNAMVDGLRQWLILQKQTQEWGDNPYTAEIVNAILTSGTDWNAAYQPAKIFINGKQLEIKKSAALTGSVSLPLDIKDASGANLVIRKDGVHPAWGGVVCSYIAPVKDVKAVATEDIRIEKAIYKIDEKTGGTEMKATSVSTGDKVRVQLTITTSRDMDYVALTDGRAACLEPVDQLSGYTATDGIFYYREVRNAATNLFFGFLPKGTWQISYDCYVDRDGEYTGGVATIQSLYAPTIVGHSAGNLIDVR